MMASVYESTGLTIIVTDNPSSSGISLQKITPIITDEVNLAEKASSYSHEIAAIGGYISARLSINESKEDAMQWLRSLGKFLYTFAPDGSQIFRATINSVTVRVGPTTITTGQLLDIANRVRLVYSPIVDAELLNIIGGRLFTDYADNTDSQDLYGIIIKDVSGGALSDPQAIDERDDYLSRFAWPKLSKTFNSGSQSNTTVQIEAVGAWELLNYPYTDLVAGDIAISTKITDILSANPNSGYITAGNITTNTDVVPRQEPGDRIAQSIIKELLGLPGLTGTRMLFSVGAEGIATYYPKPDAIKYQVNSSDKNPTIMDEYEGFVDPWNVLPGNWLYYTDLFPGEDTPNDLEVDPRAEFIETVRFTSPNIVEANGNVYSSGDARVNKKGLRGI